MKMLMITLLTLCVIAIPTFAQDQLVFSAPEKSLTTKIGMNVISEAYQRLGIPIQIKRFPAERAIFMANGGITDGAVNRIKGIESRYPNLVRVPVAINAVEFVGFSKTATFPVTGWESLRPYKIGIRLGIKVTEEGTKGMTVETVGQDEQLFLKLDSGRNDVVVLSRLNGLAQIQRLQLQGITVLEPPFASMKLYHYLHHTHADLVPRITAILKEMEAEGRIDAIREQMIEDLTRDSRNDSTSVK